MIPHHMPCQASLAEEELLAVDAEECLTSMLVCQVMFLQLFLVSASMVALLALKGVGLLVTYKGCLADEASIAGLALERPFRLWPVFPLVQQAVSASAKGLLAILTAVQCFGRLVGVDSGMTQGLVQLQHLSIAKPTLAGWAQQARSHSEGSLLRPRGLPVAITFVGT